MKSFKLFFTCLVLLTLSLQLPGQDYPYLGNTGTIADVTARSGIASPVTVTVIYDNYVHTAGMEPDWGYSIVIEGLDKTILFDTGTKPGIFRSNFEKTGLDASAIDLVVISHEHYDHVGGLPAFAKMKTGIPVIIPHSIKPAIIESMSSSGFMPLLVKDAGMICQCLYTSGEFDFEIAEQCLVLDTRDGLVVMTGCSHPGIVRMLKEIKETFGKNIVSVFGGFHLMNKSEREMEGIIAEMKALGIVRCGATHCTGEKQIEMFRKAFGDNYFDLGAGNRIVFN
ncbi:MAG: MBL fold metallo-hydrolase [Bacteroidales bacterium]|jgi:7,8-dihydropterin-6-yl-methyl-4-(beta-D-ribofuranosyl)aminobenzene 5'-phosphate synthase|nr:MBL fold metallo-hydrolase [Bacteroidales bacterium]